MANGRFRVVAVFDSDLGPVESPLTPGPVKVVFSDAGEIADDRIVRSAAGIDGPVVVVSNDRLVRERSEAVGAIAVWSQSLIEWSTSR
jgi:predicted RNA-binding protein with PIN domain